MVRRSKTNNKHFQDIPAPENKQEKLFNLCKKLTTKIEERGYWGDQKRKAHTKAYNLTLEIKTIQDQIGTMVK